MEVRRASPLLMVGRVLFCLFQLWEAWSCCVSSSCKAALPGSLSTVGRMSLPASGGPDNADLVSASLQVSVPCGSWPLLLMSTVVSAWFPHELAF